MDRAQEKEYWLRLILELQGVGETLYRIGQAIGVSERQVAAYKAGERPRGMKAIFLHNLHLNRVKRGSANEKDEVLLMAEEEVKA